MAKKINSLINIDEADKLDQDISFCSGVAAVMQTLASAKIGVRPALAEVANMEPEGLTEVLDQAFEKMNRIKELTEKLFYSSGRERDAA